MFSATWASLGPILGCFRLSRASLGPFSGCLGLVLDYIRLCSACLGRVLGTKQQQQAILKVSWDSLGLLGTMLGPRGLIVEPSRGPLGLFEAILGYLGGILALFLGQLGAILGYLTPY